MTLSKSEHVEFLKNVNKLQIEIGQAANYALNRNYKEAIDNLSSALGKIDAMVQQLKD